GRLFSGGIEHPHYGSVISKLKGSRGSTPPFVLLPKPIGPTGGNLPHAQNAGHLGKAYHPLVRTAYPHANDFQVPPLLPPPRATPGAARPCGGAGGGRCGRRSPARSGRSRRAPPRGCSPRISRTHTS